MHLAKLLWLLCFVYSFREILSSAYSAWAKQRPFIYPWGERSSEQPLPNPAFPNPTHTTLALCCDYLLSKSLLYDILSVIISLSAQIFFFSYSLMFLPPDSHSYFFLKRDQQEVELLRPGLDTRFTALPLAGASTQASLVSGVIVNAVVAENTSGSSGR